MDKIAPFDPRLPDGAPYSKPLKTSRFLEFDSGTPVVLKIVSTVTDYNNLILTHIALIIFEQGSDAAVAL